jgi:dTDP-4-dehydrorhamnose reductase
LFIRKVQPDAVIHAAAIADIDYCKAHPDEARRANLTTTANIAAVCAEVGSRLVYVSTDNVFDGERGLYTEDDAPHPVNVYGHTKLEAERRVADTIENHAIARIALVAGRPAFEIGNSFLARMLPRLEQGETIGVPAAEIRSPIDVVTVARALIEIADAAWTGTVHLAGNDVLSRLDMVRRIAAYAGFDPEQAQANDPTAIPGRDERPRDVSLANRKARAMLNTPMLGLEDGLRNSGIL